VAIAKDAEVWPEGKENTLFGLRRSSSLRFVL
jgi:hypothetical protein